jgi:hypothetical protein
MLWTVLIFVAVIMSFYLGIKLAIDKKAYMKERIFGVVIIIFIICCILYLIN